MRSTNEIVIAIKECRPVTEHELKLAHWPMGRCGRSPVSWPVGGVSND